MGKCSFRAEWLKQEDSNGCIVSEWAKKQSDTEVFCKVCRKSFSISKGFQAIYQHSKSAKHKDEWLAQYGPNQTHLNVVQEGEQSGTVLNRKLQLFSNRDNTVKAEIVWVLKCISSDYSMASCNGIRETFNEMFPGSVPTDFSLGRCKARYMITDALAPYFRDQQLKEIRNSYFTLCYDETTNAGGKKELQTILKYWSQEKSRVTIMHLETFFIGSAKAEDILQKLNEALQNASLPRSKMVMLGSDGPNVNKKIERLMNEELIAERGKSLLAVGTCNIHILHNGYLKGLEELGEDASDLIVAVYYFFKGWPARCEDYEKIQTEVGLPTNRFIKHVTSRWLTLEQAAERIIQQWPALVKYITDFIPKRRAALAKKAGYLKIRKFICNTTMKAEVLFAAESARIFTKFTGLFQKEEPLIHLMFKELETLVRTLVGRVCKPDVCKQNLTLDEAIFSVENFLPLEQIVLGAEITAEMASWKEVDKTNFRFNVRKHYIAACKHVMQKAALKNAFIKSCRCLHPEDRKSNRSLKDIVQVAKSLPLNIKTDTLMDEWNLLRQETEQPMEGRIDDYWSQFFAKRSSNGDYKYPLVTQVVKAALTVSHGNADVERGFSTSSRMLTEDRASMNERTLNALMTVKTVLKQVNNQPHLVPISKELVQMAHGAHQRYKQFLEDEKKKAEIIKQKEVEEIENKRKAEEALKEKQKLETAIKEKEQELQLMRKEENEKRRTADKLFVEAKDRLKTAIQNKDMAEIELAQAMLEGVETVRKRQASQKRAADSIEEFVNKKKASVITNYFAKK